MAAEYSANTLQTVQSNQPVVFNESPVPCNRGNVFHRDGSGSFLVASKARTTGCVMYETLYEVEVHANIAIPTGGTVEEIQLAIATDGETDISSIMRTTPAAVEQFENVGTSIIVGVPSICGCDSVSVRNISTQAIEVQNANIIFTPVGIRRIR